MKKSVLLRVLSGILALEMIVTLPGVDNITFAKSTDKTKYTKVFENNKVKLQNGQQKAAMEKQADDQGEESEKKDSKSLVSTEGIAPAFQEKDFNKLYKEGVFKFSEASGLSGAYEKNAKGLLVSGTKEQLSSTRFLLTEQFDFSEGVIERVQLDAISQQANNLIVKLYMDDEAESFATFNMIRQKRAKKWYTKILANNIYDKKLTGKHRISFTVEQKDEAEKVGFVLRSLTFVKSTVPTLYFDIDETQGSIAAMNTDRDHDTECYGSVTIQVPDGYKCEYPDKNGKYDTVKTQTYKLDYIRGRGNSTWDADKKPYKIKLDKKADLFNMGKNKHWVLLADYYDPCHIRNKNTYNIGQKLGMEYTPDSVYVDLVMNGEYYGSYLLSEQIRLDSNRVDLDNLEDISDFRTIDPADKSTITGGYLLSFLPYNETTDKIFETKQENTLVIESPSFEEYDTEEQYDAAYKYISGYVNDTEDAIYGKKFKNDKGQPYSDFMDVDSAVNYWWIQDLSMNGDGFYSNSTYMYKKRDGKLYWGPLWDFDYVAWGNNDYNLNDDEYGYYEGWAHTSSSWFGRLFQDPDFCIKAVDRWNTLKPILVESVKDNGTIDQYAKQITYSMYYNNMVYGNNYSSDLNNYSFQDSVKQLKEWINKRVNWVDSMVGSLKRNLYTIKFVSDNKVISSKQYYDGEEVEVPATPVKKDYVFVGWFIKDEGGEDYQIKANNYTAYGDETIVAKWVKKSEFVDAKQLLLGYDRQAVAYFKYSDENIMSVPYMFLGGYGFDEKIKWTSSNEKILKSHGDSYFDIIGPGQVKVTAQYTNGKTKLTSSCWINVIDKSDDIDDDYPDDINITSTRTKLKVGETVIISASASPEDCSYFYPYFSEDSGRVQLTQFGNKCLVKAVKTGKVAIKCSASENGLTRVINLEVTNKYGDPIDIKPGSKIERNKVRYEVISLVKGGGTLKVTGVTSKNITSAQIPSSITIGKKKYKVVAIGSKAFAGCKKLKSVEIGKNVSSIGKAAFLGDKKLAKITIKTDKLNAKKIGKQAFKGIYKKYKLSCPKGKKKAYAQIIGNRMK